MRLALGDNLHPASLQAHLLCFQLGTLLLSMQSVRQLMRCADIVAAGGVSLALA